MTEREFFISCIPMIAEMVVLCRELDGQDYEEWKREVMEHAASPAKSFMKKVLVAMDNVIMNT